MTQTDFIKAKTLQDKIHDFARVLQHFKLNECGEKDRPIEYKALINFLDNCSNLGNSTMKEEIKTIIGYAVKNSIMTTYTKLQEDFDKL